MNWPAYPEYKDTGVEWIGNIPDDWSVLNISHAYTVTLGKMLQSESKTVADRALPYLRAAHVQPDGLSFKAVEQSMWFSPQEASSLTLKKGDVIVVEGGAAGRTATLQEDLPNWAFQNSINRLRPLNGNVGRFADYCMQVMLESGFIDVLMGVATIPHLTAEKLSAIRIPQPPVSIQRGIVDFLDRETAKIDALIDKQHQLIATLREDRTATITHAVTKGLNPDAEMKDSGVEWLGEIPAHWKTTRISYACNILTGFPFKSEEFVQDPDEMRLLRGANVGVSQINWSDVVYFPLDSEKSSHEEYRLYPGDIVMGLDRPFISSGIRVAYVQQEDAPSLLLQRVARFRAFPEFDQKFIFFLLTSPGVVHHLTPIFTGVSVPHVSPGQVGDFAIPEAPLFEQNKIVDHVVESCKKIDQLIDTADRMIGTLREYRSALITAAVTGKIDVREAV